MLTYSSLHPNENVYCPQVVHIVFKTHEPTNVASLILLLGIAPGIPATLLSSHLDSMARAIIIGYSAFYIFLLSSIAVYRLSQLHPLYYYPGPLLCRLTNWKLVSVAAGGKQHLWFRKMHEKYGPIVRIGMY